jgi:hypothetical protein
MHRSVLLRARGGCANQGTRRRPYDVLNVTSVLCPVPLAFVAEILLLCPHRSHCDAGREALSLCGREMASPRAGRPGAASQSTTSSRWGVAPRGSAEPYMP